MSIAQNGAVPDQDALARALTSAGLNKGGGSFSTITGQPTDNAALSLALKNQPNAIIGSLARWQAAKARGATNPARALLVGDSNQTGAGSGSSGVELLGNALVNGMAYRFATGMGWRTDSICGDQNLAGAASVTYPVYDPRVTLGTGWAASGSVGTSLGCRMFQSNGGNSNRIGFQPIAACDSVKITHPCAAANNQAMQVYVGGVLQSPVLTNTGGSQTLITDTYAFTRGIPLIEVNASGGTGTGYINMIQCFDSTQATPNCVIGSWFGGTAANVASNTTAYDSIPQIAAYAPDFTLLQLTINDSSTTTALGTYYTNMELIISTAAATSDGCLEVGYPYSGAGATNGDYDSRATFMRDLARSYGWSFLDLRDTLGYSNTRANAKGYVYDTAHPNLAGHTAVAAARLAFLQAAGL